MKKAKQAIIVSALSIYFGAANAQISGDAVKIGFVTDMSSVYADQDGKNGAEAVRMAIEDFGGKVLGKPIELVTADHQNKADIAASKAREWIDPVSYTHLDVYKRQALNCALRHN